VDVVLVVDVVLDEVEVVLVLELVLDVVEVVPVVEVVGAGRVAPPCGQSSFIDCAGWVSGSEDSGAPCGS
jgi:hypothetical protein